MHSPIRYECVGELDVFPDQFIGAVVLVGDRHRAVPGDGGYVPVVIVGVDVGRIGPVPVRSQQGMEVVSLSDGVVRRTVPLTPTR